MSWVTNILLLINGEELWDEDDEELEESPAVQRINQWTQEHGWGSLDPLQKHITSGGKAMSTPIYGGALNYLRIDEFIEVVGEQAWREPENVQLLVQDAEESRFTLYEFRRGTLRRV